MPDSYTTTLGTPLPPPRENAVTFVTNRVVNQAGRLQTVATLYALSPLGDQPAEQQWVHCCDAE